MALQRCLADRYLSLLTIPMAAAALLAPFSAACASAADSDCRFAVRSQRVTPPAPGLTPAAAAASARLKPGTLPATAHPAKPPAPAEPFRVDRSLAEEEWEVLLQLAQFHQVALEPEPAAPEPRRERDRTNRQDRRLTPEEEREVQRAIAEARRAVEEVIRDLPRQQREIEEAIRRMPDMRQEVERALRELPDQQKLIEEALRDLPKQQKEIEKALRELPDTRRMLEELRRSEPERRQQIDEALRRLPEV